MKSLIALMCIAGPIVAFAGGSVGPITISGDQLQIIGSPQIAYVYVNVAGGGCTYTTPVLIMDSSNPSGNAMYATLLTAKINGGQVSITTYGCSSAGYPEISSVYLD